MLRGDLVCDFERELGCGTITDLGHAGIGNEADVGKGEPLGACFRTFENDTPESWTLRFEGRKRRSRDPKVANLVL